MSVDESCLSSISQDTKFEHLTPEQKKTISDWIIYLGKALIQAVVKKLIGNGTIVLLGLFCFSGCIQQYSPTVYTRKSWEGHYMNTNDFYTQTKQINLQNGESIWVLSNETLKNILKNVQKDK